MKNEKNNFECSICFDSAKEPVVTKCGHLYCWPCIYEWLEAKRDNTKCPICKSSISQENLIPIYTKDETSNNTNRFKIPRPKGQRTDSSNDQQNNNFNNTFSFMGSFGFIPFFGFNINFNNNRNNTPGFNFGFRNDIQIALFHLITLFFMIYFFSSL